MNENTLIQYIYIAIIEQVEPLIASSGALIVNNLKQF